MQKNQSTERPMRILKANMYAYIVTVIFLLLTAMLMTYTNVGTEKEKLILLLGVIISTFLAGSDTARGENKNGWKWGMVGALVYAIIYFVIAFSISRGNALLSMNALLMFLVMLCSGAVGGIFAINLKK